MDRRRCGGRRVGPGRPRGVHARDGRLRSPHRGAVKPEHGRTKVAAFDLTFSAPKSVSVLFAIADEAMSAALLAAHEKAVERGVRVRRAGGLLHASRAEWCVARPGRRLRRGGLPPSPVSSGDPQLHTHVVVANMTQADGRWTSLEAHGLV